MSVTIAAKNKQPVTIQKAAIARITLKISSSAVKDAIETVSIQVKMLSKK